VLARECEAGNGMAQATFKTLTKQVQHNAKKVRWAVRWLDDTGFLDTFKVLTCVDGSVLRDANVYLPLTPDAPPAPGEAPKRVPAHVG
jgi:hypothetical protein